MNFEFPENTELSELLLNKELPAFPEGRSSIDSDGVISEAIEMAIRELPFAFNPEIPDAEKYDFLQKIPEREKPIKLRLLRYECNGSCFITIGIAADDGTNIGEIKYDLTPLTKIIAKKALVIANHLRKTGRKMWKKELTAFLIEQTSNMLIVVLWNLTKRIETAHSSFLNEAVLNSTESWYDYNAELNSLDGIKMNPLSFSKEKKSLFKAHQNEISLIWADNDKKIILNNKKMLLAYHFKRVHEHWQDMEKKQLNGKEWRRYVKAGDMSNITDDLIEEFERGVSSGDIAIEHAARLAEFYNTYRVNDKNLKKRAQKVRTSGFSRSYLYKRKTEGEKLLKERLEDLQSTIE